MGVNRKPWPRPACYLKRRSFSLLHQIHAACDGPRAGSNRREELEPTAGIEPATFALRVRCTGRCATRAKPQSSRDQYCAGLVTELPRLKIAIFDQVLPVIGGMLFHCGRAIPAESNRSQTPYSGTTTPTWLQVPLHGLLPGFEPDGIRRMESRFQITGILASSQQKTREAQAGQSSKGWRILTRFFEIVAHFAVASGFQLQVCHL